uniref:Phosphatidylethanolamine N-methyltransferase n=2 Tax=Corvus TaxID=30420 RepID=A0A8C3DAK3_CORMO
MGQSQLPWVKGNGQGSGRGEPRELAGNGQGLAGDRRGLAVPVSAPAAAVPSRFSPPLPPGPSHSQPHSSSRCGPGESVPPAPAAPEGRVEVQPRPRGRSPSRRGPTRSHTRSGGGRAGGEVDVAAMVRLFGYVDVTDTDFIVAVLSIAFNPLFWNVVARWEHKTRALSQVFGSPHAACYCLGAVILVLNCVRSHCFTEAMKSQPKLEGWDLHWTYYSGLAISAVGTLFVISSFLALGFTGTFLGDYFGILMEEKVTSFPFSVLDNPMYWGSTAIYLGWSLMHASPAGLLLTAVVAISYTIAVLYEGPFTEEIYRRKQKGVKSK